MIKIMEKLKILPKPTFQVLLNNKIEKEIQRVVHSFNFPLKLFCASKYSIRHDRLYPRGHKYQCLAFCFTMFMNLVCTYRMFTVDITDKNMSESENDMVNLLSALYYLLYTIGFTELNHFFELYQKMFKVLTLCHVVNTFIRSLLALYIILFSTKRYTSSSGGATPFYIIGSFVWVSKNAILVTIHAVCCERFYIAIEEATSACIQLLKNGDYNKSQQWLYKRVKQTNRTFSKMSACGLFYVDATLVLCLMGVITNYAVVMLQFTFL